MIVSHMLYRTAQSSKCTELSRCQWWVTNWQWDWVPRDRTRHSKTSLAISRCSGAWHYKVVTRSGTEMTTIGWLRHRWVQFSEVCWRGLMQALVPWLWQHLLVSSGPERGNLSEYVTLVCSLLSYFNLQKKMSDLLQKSTDDSMSDATDCQSLTDKWSCLCSSKTGNT